MCIPAIAALGTQAMASLGSISTALTAGSGLLGAYAAVQGGRAQAAAAKATAAQQSEAARQSIEQGQQESDNLRRRAAAAMSENRLAMAANGVDLSSASAIDVLDSNRTAVEEDAFAIRENARRQAQGYAWGAANSLAEGKAARRKGLFDAMGTLLTTGAKVGEKYAWMGGQRAGGRPY